MDILKPPVDEGEENEKASDLTVFASNSTLHGISHVFLPGGVTPRRVFWAVAFLSSLSCFLFQVADRIIYYSEYHHVTTLDEMESSLMTFPAITICNYNKFRLSQLTTQDLENMGDMLGLQNHIDELKDMIQNTSDPEIPFSLSEFYERTGHSMEDMILECRYRNRECGAKNFSVEYTSNGKCYTFNSGKKGHELLHTLKGGTGNGLELMLDIQQDEYLPVFENTDDSLLEAGVKVQIHSQDEPPYIGQLGFGVAPGFQTFVSCQQQQLKYLPPPWGDCKDTLFTSPYFKNYSISACRIDCETRLILKDCNCRLVYMPGNVHYVCTPLHAFCSLLCVETSSNEDEPLCECQTPCQMVRYGKELSMVKIPSKSASKYMAKKYNRTEEYIKDNILILDIFFEALNYETIEQKKAYEVAGLLGETQNDSGKMRHHLKE
ncbi:acid-sensing ion channel 1C-like, partial [Bufo gargarizans]|uniref:acid-sensing ion channel 1C-like n=1 Tax=Bufo gargarizans TaxID=30331 RepID=UPI001CF196D6